MMERLRGPVPGQLCLLRTLDGLAEPHATAGPDVKASSDLERLSRAEELGEWETRVLRFAAQHHMSGHYPERVHHQLGCTTTRYLQTLAGLLDHPEAVAAEPDLVGRLRALRDRRQRLRERTRSSDP